MTTGREAATYPIRSVDRVCDILDTLANAPHGVSLGDIAKATGLPKSSVFRYLSALEMRNYVGRSGDAGIYKLGLAFRPQHARGLERLAELALPALQQVRDITNETTNLGVLDGTSVVHRLVCDSAEMMRLAAHVGDRGYVHATALGKAIAASLSEEYVRSLLTATGMPALTDATITDLDAFMVELAQIRRQGFAVDEEENQDGGRCVAVVIPGLHFPAAVSVSAPASRFRIEHVSSAARALQRIARELSREMKAGA